MIDLEQRLARFGDAIDELADPAVLSQFGEPSVVPVVETTRAQRRSLVPAVAALVVIALFATTLLVARHDDPPAAAPSTPTWERIDGRAAGFSHGATPICCSHFGEQLVAYGAENATARRRAAGAGAPFRAAIWTSIDGEQWTRARVDDAVGKTISIVARINGRAIAFPGDDDSGTFWTSTDGRHWRTGLSPSLSGHVASQVLRVDRGLVLVDERDRTRLLASSDGRTWTALPDAPFAGTFAAFRGGILGLEHSGMWDSESPQVWFSADGASWTRLESNLPRGAELFVPEGQHDAFVIGYDGPGVVGGHLWRSADGASWTEVLSLQDTSPNAIPYQLMHVGGWWIVGGWDTTDGRRISLWWSRDLEHWSELPRRLRGAPTANHAVLLSVNRAAVVAFSDGAIWRWARPVR